MDSMNLRGALPPLRNPEIEIRFRDGEVFNGGADPASVASRATFQDYVGPSCPPGGQITNPDCEICTCLA